MVLIRFFALFSFLCILTCVVAAVSRKRKTFFGKAYILYSLLIAGYVLTEFLNISLLDYSVNYALLKIQTLFWIPAGSAFYMFSVSVSEKKGKILYKVFLFGAVIKALLAVSTDLVVAGIAPYAFSYDIVPGVLFLPVVVVYVLLPFCLGLYELVVNLRQEKKNSKGVSKSVLILVGTLISVSVAVITDAFIPHVLKIDSVFRAGASFSVIQTLFIYIAIYEKYISKIRVEDLNHHIYRNSNNPILLLDENKNISHCNEAAYLISGYQYSDIYGKSVESIFDVHNWEICSREVVDSDDSQGSIVLLKKRGSS